MDANPSTPSPAPSEFLDVAALIERSQPRPRTGWLGYALGIFLLLALSSAYVGNTSPQLAGLVDLFSKLVMLALLVAIPLMTSLVVRRQREEFRQIEALEELVQLRRWQEAAGLVQQLLSAPTRTPQGRVQGLVYLSSILGRYQRFEDAIAVQDHLLQTVLFDEGTAHGLRLGRAMAMLRQDHLVDADRAISELRRSSSSRDSAGLALLEIYRDVKTGHPAEAVERFEQALPVLRQQLGQHVGDAYALAARAYDMLDRSADARDAWEKATLLTVVSELQRRYPEVTALIGKYAAIEAPGIGEPGVSA